MGSLHFLPFFTSIKSSSLSFTITNPNTSFSNIQLLGCSFHVSRLRFEAEPIVTGRIRFNFGDDLYTEDDDDEFEFEFEFGSNVKRRIWWSNDDLEIDEEDDEFWIFKLFRGLGWMLPAAVISSLLGTGPNPFLMALAVPLGQFVVSLAIDNVWGRKSDKPKPRARPKKSTKKKPFAKAPRNVRNSEEEQEGNYETTMGKGKSHSWSAAVDNGENRTQKFGGWDELDKRGGKRAPNEKANGLLKQQKRGKLSRRRRGGDTPFLLRLLIAVFPILGSWTKFLF